MLRLLLIIAFTSLSTIASAHVGVGDTSSFANGFTHPLGGVDHALAMIAVGLFAAHLGGRALWLVPLSFMSAMAIAGIFGMAGVPLPFVEIGIGLSIVALGLAVSFRFSPPTLAAMALVGFLAIFHGHAHGTELPENASGLAYGIGFVLATGVLHVVGIGLGLAVGRLGQTFSRGIVQVGGFAMVIAGGVLLAGVF